MVKTIKEVMASPLDIDEAERFNVCPHGARDARNCFMCVPDHLMYVEMNKKLLKALASNSRRMGCG